MNYRADDMVKTCRRLESGLRLGPEGIRACQLGSFASPIFWTGEEASRLKITKEMIVEKRRWLLSSLNDDYSDITCKRCQLVETKRYGDINLTELGQIDHAATTICNLKCSFCDFTRKKSFSKSAYDDLAILREFKKEDVQWDSVVDFNGGEPALLKNLNEHFDYFSSRGIRIRFMTNAVEYRQEVYDGLTDGSIQWVCTSVDAGTPSTYFRIKQRDYYLQVLENLTRYAHAGGKNRGMLAIKYIFCGDNCSDDDIAGFTYAMLAIRPHQVWLTFDFTPFIGLPADSEDFRGYDPSRDISAYVKMYRLMKKHGIMPVHYATGHLAAMCIQGKILHERVLEEISQSPLYPKDHELILKDFRKEEKSANISTLKFNVMPLCIINNNQMSVSWSLAGKKVLLTPACAMAIDLLSDNEIMEGDIIGILDRDQMIHGKEINGFPVYGYKDIGKLNPDVILVVSPEQHRKDIVRQLAEYKNEIDQVAVFDPSSFHQ